MAAGIAVLPIALAHGGRRVAGALGVQDVGMKKPWLPHLFEQVRQGCDTGVRWSLAASHSHEL
jgi:hypothetical protein